MIQSYCEMILAEAERLGEYKTEICGVCSKDFQPEGQDYSDHVKCASCNDLLCEKCEIKIDNTTVYCPVCVEG